MIITIRHEIRLKETIYYELPHWWLSARLRYLQCVSKGDSTALDWVIDITLLSLSNPTVSFYKKNSYSKFLRVLGCWSLLPFFFSGYLSLFTVFVDDVLCIQHYLVFCYTVYTFFKLFCCPFYTLVIDIYILIAVILVFLYSDVYLQQCIYIPIINTSIFIFFNKKSWKSLFVSCFIFDLKMKHFPGPPFINTHDDVIKWRHFPRYWPFVRGIPRSPVNSPHKGQWRGALMFSLICARINRWANNRKAGD